MAMFRIGFGFHGAISALPCSTCWKMINVKIPFSLSLWTTSLHPHLLSFLRQWMSRQYLPIRSGTVSLQFYQRVSCSWGNPMSYQTSMGKSRAARERATEADIHCRRLLTTHSWWMSPFTRLRSLASFPEWLSKSWLHYCMVRSCITDPWKKTLMYILDSFKLRVD